MQRRLEVGRQFQLRVPGERVLSYSEGALVQLAPSRRGQE